MRKYNKNCLPQNAFAIKRKSIKARNNFFSLFSLVGCQEKCGYAFYDVYLIYEQLNIIVNCYVNKIGEKNLKAIQTARLYFSEVDQFQCQLC